MPITLLTNYFIKYIIFKLKNLFLNCYVMYNYRHLHLFQPQMLGSQKQLTDD